MTPWVHPAGGAKCVAQFVLDSQHHYSVDPVAGGARRVLPVPASERLRYNEVMALEAYWHALGHKGSLLDIALRVKAFANA